MISFFGQFMEVPPAREKRRELPAFVYKKIMPGLIAVLHNVAVPVP
jgi:hypothetical protein